MSVAILYLATAVVFFAVDMVGIRLLILPVFEKSVGHLLIDPPRYAAAAGFYLGYIALLLWFVSLPALRAGAPAQALFNGALLGLMCYATYEFTNYATLTDWTLRQVVIDSLWGAALTGVSAWAGLAITRAAT